MPVGPEFDGAQHGSRIHVPAGDKVFDNRTGKNLRVFDRAVKESLINWKKCTADGSKYNGGDLRGVERRLDYIRGLGATTVWITPPVANT